MKSQKFNSSLTLPNDTYNDKGSYVARDRIWKDHCNKITFSQRKWPENWGFLNGKLENLAKDEATKQLNASKSGSSNQQNIKTEPERPTASAKSLAHHKELLNPYHKRNNDVGHHPEVKIAQSPRAVPSTTSGMIGWRSTDKLCQLEKYGRYSKGKLTITKSFNWPAEGCA